MNFKFDVFATIKGIGAASGLIWNDQNLFLISDDSDVLYKYHTETQHLEKISLLESCEILEHRAKPEKSDYEAITQDENQFYIFGSGATPARNRLAIVSKKDFSVSLKPLDFFYNELKTTSAIDDENFNIESAIIHKNSLFLFNRGNGPKRKNGVFEIIRWKQEKNRTIQYHPIPLPSIQNTEFGFTDAILVDHKIYFLAAAEAVASTYKDGETLGSILGRMDFKTLTLETTKLITDKYKLEGITLFKKESQKLHFLVCEDPDNGGRESEFFELVLE